MSCQLFSRLDLSFYALMNTLVFHLEIVFDLSDLRLKNLVSFLNLEVSNLCNKGLDFLPDVLDQLSTLSRV